MEEVVATPYSIEERSAVLKSKFAIKLKSYIQLRRRAAREEGTAIGIFITFEMED
jgi:hypothetical protein